MEIIIYLLLAFLVSSVAIIWSISRVRFHLEEHERHERMVFCQSFFGRRTTRFVNKRNGTIGVLSRI